MLLDFEKPFKYNYISFDYLSQSWQNSGYWSLRKSVFCEEQKIFDGHDRDIVDEKAIPILALDECMALVYNVVGAVRIDEREPGIWWGSRLCVEKDYRTHSRFHTNLLFDEKTNPLFTISIGAALIYKAVCTAHFLGCDGFFAFVQKQNVKLFQRLHWECVREVNLHRVSHYLMKADLNFYPPSKLAQYLKNVA